MRALYLASGFGSWVRLSRFRVMAAMVKGSGFKSLSESLRTTLLGENPS